MIGGPDALAAVRAACPQKQQISKIRDDAPGGTEALLVNILEDGKERKSLFGQGKVL
jgi:hypothetical protein